MSRGSFNELFSEQEFKEIIKEHDIEEQIMGKLEKALHRMSYTGYELKEMFDDGYTLVYNANEDFFEFVRI